MSGNGQNRKSQISNLQSPVSSLQSQIDWEEIHQRIASLSQTFGDGDRETPELLQQAWARRAERLAQVPVKRDEGEQIQLVLLRLGHEVYGLDVQYVFDIRPIEPRSVARVPRTPDWVVGVVNLRGRVFSVVDLQRFLGLARESKDDGEATRNLVIVETPDMELALLADQVLPMETVSVNQIQEATGAVRGIRPEYLRGIAERGSGSAVVILDLPALLADKQLIVHEEIA